MAFSYYGCNNLVILLSKGVSNIKTVKLKPDTSHFQEALAELLFFARASQSLFEQINAFLDNTADVELFDIEPETTMRAGHCFVIIKPSEKLLEFLAALRAGKGDSLSANV